VKSGPGLQRAEGSALVAVMRRDGALARDFALRHGVPRWYSDATELVNDPEVDAVYVASPPGKHLEHALLACAAGKPVYVEKPMARSYAECEEMLAAFAQAGLRLFVAYYRRALVRFVHARSLIHEGRLGRITSLAYLYAAPKNTGVHADDLPWRLRCEDSGGGLLLDLGSHTLDLLDYLLGPLEEVEGLANRLVTPGEVEDVVAMTFRLPDGALGVAKWDFGSANLEDRLEIQGTQGTLTLSTFGHEAVRLSTRAGHELREFAPPEHIQQPLIQTVVSALQGHGSCPSTGESAARTSRVIDQVLEGFYGSRVGAFWERPHAWPGAKRSQACPSRQNGTTGTGRSG
jgi:predicted dehydrogenase